MKKIISGLIVAFFCLASVGQANQTFDTTREISGYTLVDEIIRALLNDFRKKIPTIEIPDIQEEFVSTFLNASFSAQNISHQNVENFELVHLKSTLIPLRISNMTLHWKNVKGSALYDFDIIADIENHNLTRVFGKGMSSASVDNITFTIGANLEQKNGAFQIKPAGLFGFDLRLESANITLESLMNSEELGKVVGQFIGDMLPTVVDEFKHSIFDLFRDDFIEVINEVLRAKYAALNFESHESEEFEELEIF